MTARTSATAKTCRGVRRPGRRPGFPSGPDADRGFDPSLSFFERLARAFRDAFAAAASGPVVPEPVDAAVEDAREATAHEFVDRPDADFEAVLEAFYERVARYTCVYRELADGNRDDGPDGPHR